MATQTTEERDIVQEIAEVLKGNGKTEYKEYRDVDVERKGGKIILPERMSYDDGIKWLHRKKEEEEKWVTVRHDIRCYPLDGLVALNTAINRMFGFSSARGRRGLFGESAPRMLSVKTGVDESTTVPYDGLQPPSLEDGQIRPHFNLRNGQPYLVLIGEVKRKHEHLVKQLAEVVQRIVREESIYKGKAISVDLSYAKSGEFNAEQDVPEFMNVEGITEDSVILNDETEFSIATSVFARVESTDACKENNVPIQHGALFAGPYGTGKTLTAKLIANKCEQNEFTFIYLRDSKQLAEAIRFAEMYQPAVVFAEDIDRAAGGERDDEMNEILNTLDGIDTKNQEIVVVLTTNHPEKIHPGFLRAGRIDSVVHIGKPNAKTAERFVRHYGQTDTGESVLTDDIDLTEPGELFADMVPSFIEEGVHRAKMYAMNREGADIAGKVTTKDLVLAAKALREHVDMVEDGSSQEKKDAFDNLRDVIGDLDQREKLEAIAEDVDYMKRRF